ncbi:MAG: hypothetical protein IJJ26_10865, partial [Victivallales bacterium]|nr:hypothetical protein [Victivallales bacterium]
MSNTNPSTRSYLVAGLVSLVLLVLFVWGGYQWFCCRFYVRPGEMAVVTAKSGKLPKPGTILVEKGEQGIWREVLGEGRHFLDPIRYDVKICPAMSIPLGKIGIVTSKVGRPLPAGEIIAPDHESQGIWRDVLGPGVYRLNPEGYSIELADAINIPIGYVGIVTSQTGKPSQPGEFAKPGEKGVLKDILQPGLYYVNKYAYQVNIIEIGMNQVTMSADGKQKNVVQLRSQLNNATDALKELTTNTLNFQQELRYAQNAMPQQNDQSRGARSNMKKMVPAKQKKPSSRMIADDAALEPMPMSKPDSVTEIFGESKAVEFPSRDGFKVSLDMTVEFELLPENISKIYLLYGDLPQVVEKIILPQVLSVSRLKGSSYKAQDFIMGDGREKFQNDLRDELEKTLAGKLIVVHNAIIRNVDIPNDILTPIQSVSLAREQDLTNQAEQETAKKLAELNTETELIEQRRQEVRQETQKIVALTEADTRKKIAVLENDTKLQVAQWKLKQSEVLAKTAQLLGEAEAQAKFLVQNEQAKGEFLKAQVLQDPQLISSLHMVDALPDK